MLSRYTLFGRRSGFRRAEEGRNSYVDRYSPRLMVVLVAILGLCVLDALFTLLYIQRGGGELNPVMRVMIDTGTGTFLAVKFGLTLFGMAFLCLHKNFRFVRELVVIILALYGLLTVYHLWLATL